LRAHTEIIDANSHGAQARSRYGIDGAREQAAAGFPAVFEIGLPQLRATLAAGRDWTCACLDTLFILMAELHDTNVMHRGGVAGAALVRRRAREFISMGGTANADWRAHAASIAQEFVRHHLSPGGAADLLAATCLVYRATLAANVVE
ncbi:MAG: triphosphoribosyl-dephospho-CoA synthase, partial [Pseudomonadota bacterium]|nr:triphosphoribosyl-dephospho-CoA synthase [Pseudomonadota bacterium]